MCKNDPTGGNWRWAFSKMLTLSWAFECLNYGLREVIDVERVNSLNGRAHDHKTMKPGHCHGNGQIQNKTHRQARFPKINNKGLKHKK